MNYDEDKCVPEGPEDCGQMLPKHSRFVSTARRKELLSMALNIVQQIEQLEDRRERECLLRMIETILNENR